jgi:MFS transporter, SHS family, sialic acid transporter
MPSAEPPDGSGAKSIGAPCPAALSASQRWLVLSAALLGWMFAGLEISLFVLIARPAIFDMLRFEVGQSSAEAQAGQWFAWYQCAFLLGAAAGGWLFGSLGDRSGRTRALALAILCYSTVTGLSYFAPDPWTLLALRFIACVGVGGTWSNAVSLTVEAAPNLPRPLIAGLMGAAANVGFVLLGLLCCVVEITPDSWRWTLVVGASPLVIGLIVRFFVAESPQWLAGQIKAAGQSEAQPVREILRPPLLQRTLIGICLGAIPVIGTSANANWLVPWADKVASNPARAPAAESTSGGGLAAPAPSLGDPKLKAWTQVMRSGGAVLGSLLGGWVASLLGRRLAYFLISLASFGISSYIYAALDPLDPQFKWFTFLLGFVGVTYFGWLPLYLPELFPTRVRSTGTGVTFNSGRILAAASVLGAGGLMAAFDGDYARVGSWTGLIYVLGMVVICFAPDTTARRRED